MGNLLKSIGSRLRSRRKNLGLTQTEFAELLGVSQSYIGSIERGKENLSLEKLQRILNALDMRFDELFFQIDDSQEQEKNTALHQIMLRLQVISAADQQLVLELLDSILQGKG